jgi:hypothetical protein
MHLLFQNPAILLILIAVASRLFSRRAAAARRNAEGAAPPAQEDERTRRVREEVARKIAERRRAAEPAAMQRPGPEAPRAWRPEPPVQEEPSDIDEVLAEQRKLADEIRALDSAKPRPLAVSAATPAPAPTGQAVQAPAGWLRDLDPQGVRRAIVLREVLGPPRGLTTEGCLWR